MIAALKPQLKAIAERVDALSLRERGLIFIGVMVVLYLVAVNLVFGPLRAEQSRIEQELKQKHEQVQKIDTQLQMYVSDQGNDVSSTQRTKIQALQQRLETLDSEMNQITAGVVSPKEMAHLLEQMLKQNQGLELVKIESLPATTINDEPRSGQTTKANPQVSDVMVYKHGMRIEFKGSYFDIVNYLKALEGLPWKVFWGEVALETEKYPVSKVRLVIYTLSRHAGWIGV